MVTTVLSPVLHAEIERRFVFDDARQVEDYLYRHPYLEPLLIELLGKVQAIFQPDDPVRLRVVADSESGANQLYALVSTSLSPNEASGRLDRLDEQWWLDASERAQGRLTVDVEPR